MSEQTINVITNAKESPIQTKVSRMVYSHRMKVIETKNENQECFYLVFYKDQFITGLKNSFPKTSHLGKLFQKGIVFTTPHPLIESFLNQDQTYHFKPIDQILRSLSKKYTPQEVSLILSYFDSYLPAEKIESTMKEFFKNYQREGQLRLAFQILVMLLNFDPKNKWASDMSSHINFLKYKNSYTNMESAQLEQDPLFLEMLYFNKKLRKPLFNSVQQLLSQQSRWRDQIALYIDQLNQSKTAREQHYDSFIDLVSEHFSDSDRTILLWKSSKNMILDNQMAKQLIDGMVNNNMHEEAINLITKQRQSSNVNNISSLFEKKSLHIDKINLEQLLDYLLDESNPQNIERMLYTITPHLFDSYTIAEIYEWLQPLYQLKLDIPILDIIQKIILIKEDPDQQALLGELYHDLKLNKQAIDCFIWEMELNPSDPIPVQWLIKLYRESGSIEESNNYMYIYNSLQKKAASS